SEIVAYRDGRRWSRGYRSLALPEIDTDTDAELLPLRRQGVYLITGGLGDLALAMARRLAERFDARIVLTGRSELPPRDRWPLYVRSHARDDRRRRAIEQITAIEAAGHQIVYLRADVANPEDMARVAEAAKASFGEINGVLH